MISKIAHKVMATVQFKVRDEYRIVTKAAYIGIDVGMNRDKLSFSYIKEIKKIY